MADNTKGSLSSKLDSLKGFMKEKEPTTPIQKVITKVVETNEKEEETKFTVHIPTSLMKEIKRIGFQNDKKIKTIFVEALEAYVANQPK